MESSDFSFSCCLYQSPIETKRQKPDENGTISEDQMLNLMKQHNSDENLATIKGCSVQSAEVRYDRVVEPPDLGKAMLDTGYYFDEGNAKSLSFYVYLEMHSSIPLQPDPHCFSLT